MDVWSVCSVRMKSEPAGRRRCVSSLIGMLWHLCFVTLVADIDRLPGYKSRRLALKCMESTSTNEVPVNRAKWLTYRWGICLLALWGQAAMIGALSAQRSPRYPVPVGALHSDFKLPDVQGGQPISLSDYRGKKTLLVHFASW